MRTSKNRLCVAIFGMGYVGCVTAACLAEDGHRVIGVDVSEVKLKALQEGRTPVDEPGLNDLISHVVSEGLLRTSTDVVSTIREADLSLICVGTPSDDTGRVDLSHVEHVCKQIGEALAERDPGHVVVIRSTIQPGSMFNLVCPTLEKSSGKQKEDHFHTAFNPEFLREGSAIKDYRNPPKIVVGTESSRAVELLRLLYRHLNAPFIVTHPRVAEMAKYCDNAWHALKIVFANEIGEICRIAGIDSHKVMDIFLQDTCLNISTAYLRPGFAFGGSCLPKDLRALTYLARHNDARLPVLENINVSNQTLIENTFLRIMASGARRVGLSGLSFKPNTDDLRESPFVSLAERLIGKGIELRIFDKNLQLEKLTGTNKAYIEKHLPHLVQYLVKDINGFNDFAELVVIAHRNPEVIDWAYCRNPQIKIFDLVRINEIVGLPNYEGISW